jgi:hypothetical protein
MFSVEIRLRIGSEIASAIATQTIEMPFLPYVGLTMIFDSDSDIEGTIKSIEYEVRSKKIIAHIEARFFGYDGANDDAIELFEVVRDNGDFTIVDSSGFPQK